MSGGRSAIAAPLAAAAAVVAVALLAFSPLGAQDEGAPRRVLRGPVVSLDGAATLVDVTLAPGEREAALHASWKGADGTTTRAQATFEHFEKRLRARIELPPATSVTYDVIAASGSLARGTIDTLPAPGAKKLTFCAIGDSGFPRTGGKANENQVAIARLLEDQRPQLVLHTGDIIYLVGQPQSFDALFFEPYAATLARVPFFATLGNHDIKTKNGQPTLDEYPFPANQHGNRYYSFDAANVHFACLDSNEIERCETTEKFLATDQGKWIRSDLAAAKAEWKVVFFHFPLLSVNKGHKPETTIMRHVLEKFLDEAGVDLVVNGHDHFYHRSLRLRDYKPSEDGVVHVITGGGGAPLYQGEPKKKQLTAEFASRYHLTRFDVDGASMRIRAIGPDDAGKPETFDDATIPSRKVR